MMKRTSPMQVVSQQSMLTRNINLTRKTNSYVSSVDQYDQQEFLTCIFRITMGHILEIEVKGPFSSEKEHLLYYKQHFKALLCNHYKLKKTKKKSIQKS